MAWLLLSLAHALIYDREQQKVHEEQEYAEGERVVIHPNTEHEQKALAIRRREELKRARKEGRRRKQNAQRLEGQRREFERKSEARRQAEEEAAAAAASGLSDAACAQTPNKAGLGEYSRQGEARPRRRNEEAPLSQPRRVQQPQLPGVEKRIQREDRVRSNREKKPRAVAEADDQKVETEKDAAEFLGRDAGAPYLTITDREEHSVSPLMPHPTSAVSFAPPLIHEASSLSLGYSDLCGPCEDYQTSRECGYLFDPPQRWTKVRALTPVESAQTREDAADVLFEPPHERSGGSAGTIIPQVKFCHVRHLTDHPPNVDVSRGMHEPQRRHIRGKGLSWPRRGGRGPRDEIP